MNVDEVSRLVVRISAREVMMVLLNSIILDRPRKITNLDSRESAQETAQIVDGGEGPLSIWRWISHGSGEVITN